MSVSKQIQEFLVKLGVDVDATLSVEVSPVMLDLVLESVQTNVYDAYDKVRTTSGYERRDTGGLSDPNSYRTWVENEHTLALENNTTGNPAYAGYDKGNIVDIIESGEGYHWKKSDIYKSQMPRPFMDEAIEGETETLESALAEGLIKQGYIVERR